MVNYLIFSLVNCDYPFDVPWTSLFSKLFVIKLTPNVGTCRSKLLTDVGHQRVMMIYYQGHLDVRSMEDVLEVLEGSKNQRYLWTGKKQTECGHLDR